MNGFVELASAEILLDATKNAMMVAASVHKNKHGILPIWYIKIQNKIYIDVSFVLKVRQDAIDLAKDSCELYYHCIDELKMTDSIISRLLASKSDKYKSDGAWRTFINSTLFREPVMEFNKVESKMNEFYKILRDKKRNSITT